MNKLGNIDPTADSMVTPSICLYRVPLKTKIDCIVAVYKNVLNSCLRAHPNINGIGE